MSSSRPAKINRPSSHSRQAAAPRSMFAPRPFKEETDQTKADPFGTGGFIVNAKPELQAQPDSNTTPQVHRAFNLASLPLYAPNSPAVQRQEESKEPELDESEIQTKLAIGQPDDPYEQEADQMAAQVMRMPETEEVEAEGAIESQEDETVQRQPSASEIMPLVQRKAQEQSAEAGAGFEQQLAGQQGGGQALPDGLKSSMESKFQANFDQVRVHTDSAAVQMNKEVGAQAFTHGSDVYFNSGKYSPGSRGGQELLAHELTHTIQQTGGVQAKSDRTQLSDQPLQRLCSKCEAEPEEIQAKAMPGQASEVAVEPEPSPAAPTPQDRAVTASSPAELDQTESTTGQDFPSQSPSEINTSETSVVEERGAEGSNLATAENQQTVEIAPQQNKPATVVENGSAGGTEASTNPATQAVQAVDPQQVQLPKEVSAPAEGGQAARGEQANGSNSESTDQIESATLNAGLKVQGAEASASNQTSSPGGSTEAANSEVVSQTEQASATANDGKAQLETTNAQAEQMASAGISFAPPEVAPEQEEVGQTIAMQPEGSATSSTLLLEQNARAGDVASGFLATAAEKVQTITQLGAAVPGRIQAAAATAKTNITAALEQQKAMVSAHLAQLRTQAQSETQATIAQIQAQSQAAIAALPAATAQARDQVEAEHTASIGIVDARESSQITRIEGIYTHAANEFRSAGSRVGDEAIGIANQKANEYRSRDSGAARAANFIGLGAVSDVAFGSDTLKNKARAQAAEAVGQEYKKGLVEEANKQADKALEGKSKDIETVHQTATKSREALQTQRQAAIDSLTAAEQNAIAQAQETQTQLIASANQSLEATLSSLDQQETTQIQLLSNQGQQQIATIDSNAQQTISSLQNALNQSASSLQNSLQAFQAQARTIQAPDPNQLSASLAQAQGQIDSQIASIQGQIEQSIAASEQGLIQGGQQAIEGLNAIGQSTIEGTVSLSEGLTTTMMQLVQSATDTFTKLQENHTKTTTETATTTVDGFKKVTEGVEKTFDEMGKGLEDQFQKHIQAIEGGLRGALDKLPQDIETEAEKAAAKVDPTKELLKLILVIAVVIVVALVVGPFAAGLLAPLGTLGTILSGAIVGALAAGIVQIGNNVIDGKKWHEGVLQAMAIGAVTGAIGAGVGLGLNAVANKLGAEAVEHVLGKFAVEFGKNFTSDIIINVSTGQFSWDNIGQSLLIALLATGVSSSKFGQRAQQSSYDAGASTGSKVKAIFTPSSVDTPQSGTAGGTTTDQSSEQSTTSQPDDRVTQSSTPDETNSPPSSTPDEATPQQSALDETPHQSTPPEKSTPPQSQTPDEATAKSIPLEETPATEPTTSDNSADSASQTSDQTPSTQSPDETTPPQSAPLEQGEKNIRIIRQDKDFHAPKDKGKPKSHLAGDGALTPANPEGSATPLEHVYGTDPAKGDSPYTSFMTEEGGVAKTYGSSEIELDLPKLQADIEAGHVTNIEVIPPEQISGMIKAEIQQIAGGTPVDIDAAFVKGPQGIDEYVASLGLSKGKTSKLGRRLLAYYNTTRDGEYLVKGTISAKYLKGPKPVNP